MCNLWLRAGPGAAVVAVVAAVAAVAEVVAVEAVVVMVLRKNRACPGEVSEVGLHPVPEW